MGTATMELNLAQELVSTDKDPLFLVFLDLSKAYNTVDRGRLIRTLEGYGAGPHICELLSTFWVQQEVFTIQNGYHGQNFKATRRTT